MALHNTWGKPMDDFDILKIQYDATEIAGVDNSYSVISVDGVPMCGFVGGNAPIRITAQHWQMH